MTRFRPLLAALTAAALLTGGCTSGDDPKPNYSSVSTTPTSASPTESNSPVTPNTTANNTAGTPKPALPPAATSRNSDGGLAFSAYYWRMLDWAYATNDSSVLQGLSTSTCKSCEKFRTSIATDVGAGYTLIGGRIAIKSVEAAPLQGGFVPAELAFDVALSVDALQERATDGAVATSYPSSATTQRTYLSWVDGKWTVVNTAQVNG